MRRYLSVAAVIITAFTIMYVVAEALQVPLLTGDPFQQLPSVSAAPAAALGVGLLVIDVVLPVPSSVVMVMHGALFGVILGTALSMAGSVGAALVGFAIGRCGGPLLNRLLPESEGKRADALLERWGVLAIVVTRPICLLAETTVLLAGASRSVSWAGAAAAAAIGSLPAAALYAVAGAIAASFENLALVFAVVVALGALTWWAERRFASRSRSPGAARNPAGMPS